MDIKEKPVCQNTNEEPTLIGHTWICKESGKEMHLKDDEWLCDECAQSGIRPGGQIEIEKPRVFVENAILDDDLEDEEEDEKFPRPRGG